MTFRCWLLALLCATALFVQSLVAGYPPANLELSKGKFLIATSKLGDPRFMQTVVLLIHYDQEGALGLIVNYPSGVNLSEAFPDLDALKRVKEQVFYGGPVERSKAFLLIRSLEHPDESTRVFDHVYVSTSQDVLQERAPALRKTEKLRVFAGYSGWTAGQLEGEIQSGHWLVWHPDAEIIFDKPTKDVWPEMIRRASILQATAMSVLFRSEAL